MARKMKALVPGTLAKLRGVITGVPLNMSTEDVTKEIHGGKVVNAPRMKTNRDGIQKDSLKVLPHFESILPKSLQIGDLDSMSDCMHVHTNVM